MVEKDLIGSDALETVFGTKTLGLGRMLLGGKADDEVLGSSRLRIAAVNEAD